MPVTRSLRPVFHLRKRVQSSIFACSRYNSSSSSTEPNVLKSPFKSIEIPKISISELVFDRTEKWGNLIATECSITGRNYTYGQMQKYAKNLTGALRKKFKLNKGDVVAVHLPNSPEYAIVALGILHGGMIATTLNPIYTKDEVARQLVDSGAKVIITLNDLWPLAKAAVDLSKKPVTILTANSKEGQSTPQGAISLKEMLQQDVDISDISQPSADEIAFLPYSSGTTGLPKGVELTHFNIISNLYQLGIPDLDYLEVPSETHQETIPNILPQFHIYGLTVTLLFTTLKGCKNISLPKFDPKLFIETLVKHRPSALLVAPPLIIFMSQDVVKAEYLSSIRRIVCGAAPLGALDEERFLTKVNYKAKIAQGYGMTETSPVISFTSKWHPLTPGSSGQPVSNTEVKIVDTKDPTLPALGPKQHGELMVRGPQIMKGYHNRPKETQDIFHEGWLRTGDIGFYDDNGNLTITDRLKELIKVKGFQVPPAELEEVIREYPDVAEVGVIGIPHELYGEVPRAYISVKPGAQFDENKLHEFVKNKVASYKELKGGIGVIDSIPKNAAGKILRRQLKNLYEQHQR
ncbi:hypothetical protein WA026_013922 [Henosepilachna vigintioctopunctata]|uniref:4-coumarate--CoA ligase n=1 Tax=Henosepilachna vigintioctopunctata TaxID=420089 RepID=A0AAW1U1Y6_9CUCU